MPAALSLIDEARLIYPGLTDEGLVDRVAAAVLHDLGYGEPPIRLEVVASSLGILDIQSVDDLDVAGCLLPAPDGALIQVRKADSPRRQRFTVGHECGHIFLPGYALTPQYRCSPTARRTRDEIEALCDRAASRLLLPDSTFTRDARAGDFTFETVSDLSEGYEASMTATAIRFVEVWPEPTALLVFERRQKPSQYGTGEPPLLRLQWHRHQGDWPYLPQHKSASAGDIFDRAEQGEIVTEHNIVISGLARQPIRVDAFARPIDFRTEAGLRTRVVALLRLRGRGD